MILASYEAQFTNIFKLTSILSINQSTIAHGVLGFWGIIPGSKDNPCRIWKD